ncbi:hypothetical protein ACM66B_002089 [Microbotryomycetes sp. NB124-2]
MSLPPHQPATFQVTAVGQTSIVEGGSIIPYGRPQPQDDSSKKRSWTWNQDSFDPGSHVVKAEQSGKFYANDSAQP